MRLSLAILLSAAFMPLGYAEVLLEDAGLQPCRDLKGLERSECRSLQELKSAGEFIPKLHTDGLSCAPGQILSARQREWCLLKEGIERQKIPETKDMSRGAKRAQARGTMFREVRGAFAKEASQKHKLFDKLVQDQLRGRQSNLNRSETFEKHTRVRQENRGAGGQKKSDRVLDVHGKNTFQRGKLRYFRNRPMR